MKNEQSNIKKAFHFYNLQGIRFDAYIKTNETSKTPCFYLATQNYEPSKILIEKAEYSDENTRIIMDESDLLILNDVLMYSHRESEKMTNWEYIVKLWNEYNENKISTENLKMPFYNRLKTTGLSYDENNGFIETGFDNIDEALEGGFKRGDLVLVASRPGVGKSSFALNIFKNLCIDKNLKGKYFSLDMKTGEIKQRLLSQLSGVNIRSIINYTFSKDEYDLITSAREKIESNNILINDCDFPLNYIARNIIGLKNEKGLDFVIIDGLQQIKHNSNSYCEISYVLKRIAKKLNIIIILVSQLPRTIEERKNHRPKLQDLIAYDAIEEDCDVIMFLYNHDYYTYKEPKGIIEINIAKTRHGKKQTLNYKFDKSILKFTNNDKVV